MQYLIRITRPVSIRGHRLEPGTELSVTEDDVKALYAQRAMRLLGVSGVQRGATCQSQVTPARSLARERWRALQDRQARYRMLCG